MTPGKYIVIHDVLVAQEKVLLPPLHIKLGLVKQFVKVSNVDSDAFQEIRRMFLKLSDAKIRVIFFTPEIATMLRSIMH